jgi:2-aminoadipate transaminase
MPDPSAHPSAAAATARYAKRAKGVPASSPAGEPAGMISFGSGDAYPEALPDLTPMALLAAGAFRRETLQYAPRFGLTELREWIAAYLEGEGIRVTPDAVLVVHGAKQGIELVCKLFLDPGDAVVVTRPTYQSALGIFRGWEVEFVEIELDAEGLDVDALETRLRERERAGRPVPKLVYDVPEFHNPTGVTLSRRRRERLLELADRHDFFVVEDDPYRRIRFEGTAVPPIQALDPSRRTIGLGTFAKLVAPGLRVGWTVASPDIVARMAALKADGGSCPFTQRLILEYCRAGMFEPQLRDRVNLYRGHRDVMVRALREQLPQGRFDVPSGGYYLWLGLPAGTDTDRLLPVAKRRGVDFLPGSRFYATPGPPHHLRLAYSHASPSAIIEGVRHLREAIGEMRGPDS